MPSTSRSAYPLRSTTHAYVRRHLVETVGEDDPRVARWDAFDPAP